MLIEAGELPPGLFSSAKIITALIQRRTNAFDGIPEVYQRGTVDAVLGACSVADRRGRWRHNAVIAALPLVKMKGKDALPSEAAIAKDGEARTTLRRLAARLPHGAPDGLAAPAPPVSLVSEHDPDMPVLEFAPGALPLLTVPPGPVQDTEEEVVTEEAQESGADAGIQAGTVDTAEEPPEHPAPTPTPSAAEVLDSILAAGRTPDPREFAEADAYLLWLKSEMAAREGVAGR